MNHFSCQIIIDLTKMFYPNQPQTRNHTRNISYIILSIICLGSNSLHISYSSIQMDDLSMQYEPIRHVCTIIFIDELHNKTLVDTQPLALIICCIPCRILQSCHNHTKFYRKFAFNVHVG